jgi:CRISPR-associated protein Cas6
MFWQEETDSSQFEVPDRVVDLVFSIDCRELPVDHAHALSRAVLESLSESQSDSALGVHTVHVAGSQNGWERPEHGSEQSLILSRRTKLTIRVPGDRREDLRHRLEGASLNVAGYPLNIGKAKVRPLSKHTTLFARYVVVADRVDEDEFLQWAARELGGMDIRIRKALCGKAVSLHTPQGPLHTRSLMLANLSVEESLRLQERGLGSHRQMGCGIFLPHKGIDAVKKLEQD